MQNNLLFRVYTYINLLIQKYIFRKKIKSIDFFLSRVLIKKSRIENRFNLECVSLACQYYRNALGLDFKLSFKDGFYYIEMPFLKIGYNKNYDFSKSELARYILQNSRYLANLRIVNKGITFKLVWLDCHKHNCFVLNNCVYPLDLESFAFKAYSKSGKEITELLYGYNCLVKRVKINNQDCFIV